MEIIGLEQQIDRQTLALAIKQLFPARQILFYEGQWEKGFLVNDALEISEAPEPLDDYKDMLTLEIEEGISEFATRLTLYRAPEAHSEERELYIAVCLARYFNCRTIIDCPPSVGKPSHYPYCSMIVDPQGRLFEANDCNTDWADGEGGPVRIVQELNLPVHQFDAAGNLVS